MIKNEQPQHDNVEKNAAPIDNLGEIKVEEKIDDDFRTMPIFLKTLTGGTLVYNVSSTDTIDELKKRIQERESLSVGVHLIFEGRRLDDNRTFEDYHIQKETTISLILRLSGD